MKRRLLKKLSKMYVIFELNGYNFNVFSAYSDWNIAEERIRELRIKNPDKQYYLDITYLDQQL